MSRAKDVLVKIERNFKSIQADLEVLEDDLRHFHRKDERKRFDDLKRLVRQLRRQVQELSAECETCT